MPKTISMPACSNTRTIASRAGTSCESKSFALRRSAVVVAIKFPPQWLQSPLQGGNFMATTTAERRSAKLLLSQEVPAREAIVRVLEQAGIDMVFGMPGGNAGAIFNALYDHKT